MRQEVSVINNYNLGRVSDSARDFAVFCTSEQALQDCNFYCKQDTGALIQSAVIHSDMRQGVLKWTMPYAEKQYLLPSARKDKNPNASPEWCSKAESMHKRDWDSVFVSALRRGGMR